MVEACAPRVLVTTMSVAASSGGIHSTPALAACTHFRQGAAASSSAVTLPNATSASAAAAVLSSSLSGITNSTVGKSPLISSTWGATQLLVTRIFICTSISSPRKHLGRGVSMAHRDLFVQLDPQAGAGRRDDVAVLPL